jgi:broad specificity phosphatase PhoE
MILSSEFLRAQQTAHYLADRLSLTVETNPLLNEFNTLCHTLIEDLTGEQRRPIADKYWANADPHLVMGQTAESFIQSSKRVSQFLNEHLRDLPDQTVIFGHDDMSFGGEARCQRGNQLDLNQ